MLVWSKVGECIYEEFNMRGVWTGAHTTIKAKAKMNLENRQVWHGPMKKQMSWPVSVRYVLEMLPLSMMDWKSWLMLRKSAKKTKISLSGFLA